MVNIYRSPKHELIRIDGSTYPYLYEVFQEMMANSGGGGASYDAYEVATKRDLAQLEDILTRMTSAERSLFANGSTEDGDPLDKTGWTPAMHELDEFLDELSEGDL